MFKSNRFLNRALLLCVAVVVLGTPVHASEKYVLGRCQVSRPSNSASIRPTSDAEIYLYDFHRNETRYKDIKFDDGRTKITLVQSPIHGSVDHVASKISNNYYKYQSVDGYYGKDRFAIQVETDGVNILIKYKIEVVGEDESSNQMCKSEHWKISAATPVQANAIL